MHTLWYVLFWIFLIAALVLIALIFASTVSEKFLPYRKIFGILLVIFAFVGILCNRQYQLSFPEGSQPATSAVSSTSNIVQEHFAPLTDNKDNS